MMTLNDFQPYSGKRWKTAKGYIRIYINGETLKEHRWVYEQYHKCCLLSWSDIHHINGIKDDNRPQNLEAVSHGKHIALRNKGQIQSIQTRMKRSLSLKGRIFSEETRHKISMAKKGKIRGIALS